MKTRTLTLFFLCMIFTFSYAQNDAYHDALLNQLQAEYGLAGGEWIFTPDEATNAANAIAYGHTTTQNTAVGQDFSLAINLDIAGAGMNPWDAGYYNENINTVEAGDRVLTVIWLRTVSAAFAAPGKINMYVERPVTYDKEFFITTNPTPQWQQYLIPFEASGQFVPGQMRVGFHLAFQEQVIEFGGLAMINYGTSVALEDLPQELHNDYYPGIEPDAPWRTAAADRIEQHRKADLELQVLDAAGNAIPNADVEIEMVRHLYAFGTAIDTRRLAGNSGFDATYQEKLLDLDGEGHGFNWIVTENSLKWRAWEQGWAGTQEETVNALNWLSENNIKSRGHVLLWPGWNVMPDDMQTNSGDPAYLTGRISEHLNEMLNTPGVREHVREWDIINEPAHVRDLEMALQGTPGYTTGREIYPEVFNAALAEDPNITAYLNDYNILSNGTVSGGDYTFYKSIAQEIIDAGATIDGFGMQAHMGSALTPPDSIYAILEDCYQTFGKTIKITEYDQSDVLEDDFAARYTSDFLTMVFSHPATDGFFMWGFWDNAHWLDNAPLYNADWTPKATHTAFTNLLFNEWWTEENASTDADGNVSIRGFKGDYIIRATIDGEEVSADLELYDDVNTTIQLLPTATQVPEWADQIKVFPNPANDFLQVELPYFDKWTINIIDETGRLIQTNTSVDLMAIFETTNLSAGVYYLKIRNDDNEEISKKVVLVR